MLLGILDINQVGTGNPFPGYGDGLYESHDISLWDINGNLLSSVTVPSGDQAEVLGGFRYMDISPFTLSASETYVIGAHYLSDIFSPNRDTYSSVATDVYITEFDSHLDMIEGWYAAGNAFPDTQGSPAIGPSFMFTVVPIPASVWLFGSGLLGLTGIARRKKR